MTDKNLTRSGIMYFDSGFYVLRQIMPYPLGETNVFLTESKDGWSVIDVGVDLESTRRTWEQAVREIGISFKQIKHIYITHCHPDHMGAARWLQECSDAPVYMLRKEIDRARNFIFLEQANFKKLYRQTIMETISANQFPEDKLEELIHDWYAEVRPLYLEPAEILPIDTGDTIDLGGNNFSILSAPGHTDGQAMFWSNQHKYLVVADVVTASGYLHFSDWPNTWLNNPLADTLSLFEKIQALEVKKAFPGHGPIITDINLQIDKLIAKHQKMLDRIETAVTNPMSAGELYPHLFRLTEYVHGHRVTLGETLGYLNYLVSQGRLNLKKDNGLNLYMPV